MLRGYVGKERCEDFSFFCEWNGRHWRMLSQGVAWSDLVCKGEFWSLVENLCMDKSHRWGLSREVIPAWRMVPAVELEGGRRCADQLHMAWVRKAPRMTPIVPVLSNDSWICLSCGVCVGIDILFIRYVFSPFILGHKIGISFWQINDIPTKCVLMKKYIAYCFWLRRYKVLSHLIFYWQHFCMRMPIVALKMH